MEEYTVLNHVQMKENVCIDRDDFYLYWSTTESKGTFPIDPYLSLKENVGSLVLSLEEKNILKESTK